MTGTRPAQRLDEATRVARGVVTEAAAGDGGARTNPPRAAATSGIRCGGRRRRTRRDASRWTRWTRSPCSSRRPRQSGLLITEDDPASKELACRWAQEWVDRLAAQNRPQALLRARRLLGACLAAAGRSRRGEGRRSRPSPRNARSCECCVTSSTVVRTWSPRSRNCSADQRAGRWRPEWPEDSAPISSIKRSMPK